MASSPLPSSSSMTGCVAAGNAMQSLVVPLLIAGPRSSQVDMLDVLAEKSGEGVAGPRCLHHGGHDGPHHGALRLRLGPTKVPGT